MCLYDVKIRRRQLYVLFHRRIILNRSVVRIIIIIIIIIIMAHLKIKISMIEFKRIVLVMTL